MAGEKRWSLGQVWLGWTGVVPASQRAFFTETLSMEANSVGGFNDVKTGPLRFVVLFAGHKMLIRR